MKLKDIDFGVPEGKEEASKAIESSKLKDIFYSGFGSYDEMLESNKFLVLGKKGTGKTLLAEYFKEIQVEEGNIVSIIDESDFFIKKLEAFNYNDITEQEMILFWEYFFLERIAQVILENTNWLKKKIYPSLRQLKKLKTEKRYISRKVSSNKKEGINSSFKTGIGKENKFSSSLGATSETELLEHYEEEKYYKDIEPYRKAIINSFKHLENKKIFLIFDDLDELEIFVGSFESKKIFMISMARTVRKINDYFNNANCGIKLFLLMRQDMADDLNKSNNFGKIEETNSIKLDWSYRNKIGVINQPLTQMLLKKIRASSEEFVDQSDEVVYNSVFPGKVNGRNMIKFMIDNSFGRPRDFVLFMITIQRRYGDKERVKASFMTNSLSEYSNKLYKQLENELFRHQERALLEDGILLIKDTRIVTFSLDDLIETYKNDKFRYPAITNKSLIEPCMKILYKYNVIGTSIKSHSEQERPRVEFYYRDNAIDNPNLKERMSVHFGLRSALNVVIVTNIEEKKTS